MIVSIARSCFDVFVGAEDIAMGVHSKLLRIVDLRSQVRFVSVVLEVSVNCRRGKLDPLCRDLLTADWQVNLRAGLATHEK